jgi:ribosomal protein S18 acetylase RimI-like enzyme
LNQNRYENIKSRSNEGTTVVYCVDDKIIGTGNIIADEINSLYVDPVYHNRGIGKKILDQLIDVAQQNDFQKIHLESPPGALKFFLKHGFRVSKEDIKYIDGNYPIHFFKLELSLS